MRIATWKKNRERKTQFHKIVSTIPNDVQWKTKSPLHHTIRLFNYCVWANYLIWFRDKEVRVFFCPLCSSSSLSATSRCLDIFWDYRSPRNNTRFRGLKNLRFLNHFRFLFISSYEREFSNSTRNKVLQTWRNLNETMSRYFWRNEVGYFRAGLLRSAWIKRCHFIASRTHVCSCHGTHILGLFQAFTITKSYISQTKINENKIHLHTHTLDDLPVTTPTQPDVSGKSHFCLTYICYMTNAFCQISAIFRTKTKF